jgi:Nidogen-like
MISRILFVITSCATLVFGQGVNPLSITQLNPTSFQLSWYAHTLRPYQIENSPDLVNWTELTGYIEGTNAQQGVLVTKTTDKMFFRLRTGAMRPGFDSKSLTADDDANSSDLEPIGFPINVFPTTENPGPWEGFYVNNNGNVTVGTPSGVYTPLPLQSSAEQIYGLVALIAPFWGDVDTRPAALPETANGSKVVTYGQGQVDGRPAFGVNWSDVGYFTYSGGATDKLNSFQLVLIDRSNVGSSGDFDVEFNYNQILWETGEASGGSGGYGGTPARVGITNGVDRTIEAQYSGETIKQLDFTPSTGNKNYTTGLIYRKRNSTVPGRQVFQFRGGNLLDALQVYAGPDYPVSSTSTTVSTPLATASDPSGGAITVQWSVLNTTSTTPVVITNGTSLNATFIYSLGSTTDMLLVARRTSDPTVSASDVMTINH